MKKITNVLINSLTSVGLDEISIALYQHLWYDKENQFYSPNSGVIMKVNITLLAKQLGTSRNTVYQSLSALELVDLVSFLNDSKNRFVLHSIEVIKSKLLQKEVQTKRLLRDFDEYLPDLLGNYGSIKRKSYITKMEGRNSFIYYLTQIEEKLEPESEILIMNEGEDFYHSGIFDYLFTRWQDNRIKRKVKVKINMKQNNVSILDYIKNNKRDLRETKFLPQGFDALGCYWVISDELIHFDTALDRVVAIQDQSLAKLHTQLFYQVWLQNPKPNFVEKNNWSKQLDQN